MLKIAIIFIIFSQTFESTQEYFERFKQTVNEETFCTVGKKLNPTITILFWNKLVDGMIDGLGFEPFQTCLHKSCISIRDKSLLNNSKHTIDAIVFYGGAKGSLQKQNQIDLTEMKQFKESNNIIEQMNQGIKPKIILFMPVRNKTRFHLKQIFFCQNSYITYFFKFYFRNRHLVYLERMFYQIQYIREFLI